MEAANNDLNESETDELEFSPFYHLLDTRTGVPPPSEAAAINALVQNRHAHIAELEIDAARLLKKIRVLKAVNASRKAILSSLRRIPPEIMSAIFMLTVQDTYSWRALDSAIAVAEQLSTLAPWNLALVCRSWRDHVLASPLLWSFINIECFYDEEMDDEDPEPTFLVALCTQLQRSAEVDLHLTVYPDEGGYGNLDQIASTLHPHLHRCSHMSVPAGLFDYIGCQLTRLASFSIGDFDDLDQEKFGLLRNANNLRHVAISSIYDTSCISAFSWSQLTSLEMNFQRLSNLLPVLGAIKQNIVSLNLSFHSASPAERTDTVATKPLVFSSLKSLRLCGSNSTLGRDIISLLLTPKLEIISIVELDDRLSLSSLINRSSCIVAALRIDLQRKRSKFLFDPFLGRNIRMLDISAPLDIRQLFGHVFQPLLQHSNQSRSQSQPSSTSSALFSELETLVLREVCIAPTALFDALQAFCLLRQAGMKSKLSLIRLTRVKLVEFEIATECEKCLNGRSRGWSGFEYSDLWEERAAWLAIKGVTIVFSSV